MLSALSLEANNKKPAARLRIGRQPAAIHIRESRSKMSKGSNFWRQAGLTYLQYVGISSKAVRASLKVGAAVEILPVVRFGAHDGRAPQPRTFAVRAALSECRPESSVGIFLTCDVIVFPFFSV